MTSDNPSIISHLSLGTRDMGTAMVFYDAVMAAIGATRQLEIKHDDKVIVAIAYGKQFPEFWIQIPENSKPAETGNGVHVAFTADCRESVHLFHEIALKNGGTDNGAPGPRPHYGEQYYGCFIGDPDGNRIEASYWEK